MRQTKRRRKREREPLLDKASRMPEERAMHPLADLLICLRFFSRLPVPTTARELALGADGLPRAIVMVPLAGAVLGLFPALSLSGALAVGLPPSVAGALAVAMAILVSGALHEDGLADCADGFGGGRTRARKLEIMRDSRIGTFGACAIGLSIYLRASSLGVIAGHGWGLACAVLVASGAVSRVLSLLPLTLLPPARSDGAGASMITLDRVRLWMAFAGALVIGVLPVVAGATSLRAVVGIAVGLLGAIAVVAVARRQIGGQTGDVAGATQQVAEIAILLVYAADRVVIAA